MREKLAFEDFKDKDKLFNVLVDEHTLLEFHWGSIVYGTATESSDTDVISVVDDEISLKNCTNGIWEYFHEKWNRDCQFVNESTWIEIVRNHGIQWLECYSLPEKNILMGDPSKYLKYFELDKWKVRQVCSQISSNSWAKAHKKMTVEKDYNLLAAQKSMFHCFRIMMFAEQIGKYGKIIDYSCANHYLDEIKKLGDAPWPVYKEKFQPVMNSIRSQMVKAIPKPEEYCKERMENSRKKK